MQTVHINTETNINIAEVISAQPHLQVQHPLPGVVDEVAGQGAGRGAVGQDDGVLGVAAPLDEELAGEARLQVGLAAQHHLGAGHTRQVRQAVAQRQVAELEGVVPLVLEAPHELVTHPLHLCAGREGGGEHQGQVIRASGSS